MASGRDLPHSFRDALETAKQILGASSELVRKGSIDAEAEQIVLGAYRFATGRSLARMEFFSRLDDRLPEEAAKQVLIFAGTRTQGKPLQHILGYQAFYNHEYEVSPDVLIPRPETEVLVSLANAEMKGYAREKGTDPELGIEIGIGSGVISIEMLAAFPQLRMLASELKPEAAMVARRNAERILGKEDAASRLTIAIAPEPESVWPALETALRGQKADFLVSNPPYLQASDPIEAEVLRHDPRAALFAPPSDPLFFYREMVSGVRRYLREGGWIFLEVPHQRARDIADLFDALKGARLLPDLTGRDRILIARI
jgi:release factor glutamine methyltransferase